MKLRFQTIFVLFLALGVISTSCNKDDDGDSSSANSFTLDGTSYDLANGFLTDFGDNGNGSFDFDVTLTSSSITADGTTGYFTGTGDIVYLDLNSSSADGLVAGTYNFANNRDVFTLVDGTVGTEVDASNGDGTSFDVTAGTVEVAINGSSTSFDFTLTLSNNEIVTGSWEGVLVDN